MSYQLANRLPEPGLLVGTPIPPSISSPKSSAHGTTLIVLQRVGVMVDRNVGGFSIRTREESTHRGRQL